MIALALIVFFATGTVIALALVSGARRTGPHLAPMEPILRITPRERRSELDGGAR